MEMEVWKDVEDLVDTMIVAAVEAASAADTEAAVEASVEVVEAEAALVDLVSTTTSQNR